MWLAVRESVYVSLQFWQVGGLQGKNETLMPL